MMSLLRRAWNLLRHMEWRFYKWRRRKRLKNHDFTILATNCIGTVIYHDLGLEFLSPYDQSHHQHERSGEAG